MSSVQRRKCRNSGGHSLTTGVTSGVLILGLACVPKPRGLGLSELPSDPPWQVARVQLPIETTPGLSGLMCAGEAGCWAVSERDARLISISAERMGISSDANALPAPVTIEGIPADTDLESIAWLGDGRFVAGTERHESRQADGLLFFQWEGSRAATQSSVTLEYAHWGLKAERNRGIEGLCAAGDWIVAGVETVLAEDGRRAAPIALYQMPGSGRPAGRWIHTYLWLTSDEGKLASLDCALDATGQSLELYAIERHYGVARVLQVRVPLDAAALEALSLPGEGLTPALLVDLAARATVLPNFEGVVTRSVDELWLISDNQSLEITGPAEVWRVWRGR